MPSDPLSRRYYVITTFGEVGPVAVEEFPDLIEQRRIQTTDLVRGMVGKPVGSVAEVLEGRVPTGRSATGAAPAPEVRRRRSGSGMVPVSPAEPAARFPLIWVLGGILAVLVVLLIFHMPSSGGPSRRVAPQEAAMPELILVAGRQRDDGVREVLIRTPAAVEQDVDVQVRTEGMGGVRLDPPEGLVSMRAGSDTVTVLLKPEGITAAQQVVVSLATSSGYRIGAAGRIAVTVVPAPRPFRWDPPGLLWETFSCSIASPQFDSGRGWKGRWDGGNLKGCLEPFPALAAYPRLPPIQGHALVVRPPREGRSWRHFTQPIDSGTMWLSCRMQAVDLASGRDDWVWLALSRVSDMHYYIGCLGDGPGVKWISAPRRDAEVERKAMTRPTRAPLLVVLRLVFTARGVDADTWYDPPAGQEPVTVSGQRIAGIPPFVLDGVHFFSGTGCSMRVADLRIGRTWQEVVPP